MATDEMRALLVEQGAQMIIAREKLRASARDYVKAERELAAAQRPLIEAAYEQMRTGDEMIPFAEQVELYRASIVLAGYLADDARFKADFARMEEAQSKATEYRLIAQLPSAAWN